MNNANGPRAIGWAGQVFWPGHGLLEIESGKRRKDSSLQQEFFGCSVKAKGILRRNVGEDGEPQVRRERMTFKRLSNSESLRPLDNS